MGEKEGLNFEVERLIRTLLRGGRWRMAQVRIKLVVACLVLQYSKKFKNKLASLEATLVRNYERVTYSQG